ncbi:MAG TPA: GIY-YIG nuclease family protein [Urbifossiella sp.]|nr:GIY-YIG nuclease family protein [Urbifossiella sp.]
MTLNDLLKGKGLDPEQVLVFRHRPPEAKLNRVFPWLAQQRPDLFNAFQQSQPEKLERAMQKAKYVASFIARGPDRALFVGLYEVVGWKSMAYAECAALPENVELTGFGMSGFSGTVPRPTVLWFDLSLTALYAEWKGRLIVGWPPPPIVWWRRAHRNEMPVLAIREDNALDDQKKPWDELALTWDELRVLPARLQTVIGQWRGVYYIFDTSDCRGYVGSAYGEDNIMGRWLGYAATGHGGNVLLRTRDPKTFRFSILQRVSPDMPADDVIRVERTWKLRLHTRQPFGLNDN